MIVLNSHSNVLVTSSLLSIEIIVNYKRTSVITRVSPWVSGGKLGEEGEWGHVRSRLIVVLLTSSGNGVWDHSLRRINLSFLFSKLPIQVSTRHSSLHTHSQGIPTPSVIRVPRLRTGEKCVLRANSKFSVIWVSTASCNNRACGKDVWNHASKYAGSSNNNCKSSLLHKTHPFIIISFVNPSL